MSRAQCYNPRVTECKENLLLQIETVAETGTKCRLKEEGQ
jgi:hypothetical protein